MSLLAEQRISICRNPDRPCASSRDAHLRSRFHDINGRDEWGRASTESAGGATEEGGRLGGGQEGKGEPDRRDAGVSSHRSQVESMGEVVELVRLVHSLPGLCFSFLSVEVMVIESGWKSL